MKISYDELIESGLYGASLVLKQTTELVTSHDGQRIVNSDYGNSYYMLQLNFRYYPKDSETAPPIDSVFSLGMTEQYILPLGQFSEAVLAHSNVRGENESGSANVLLPGSTELNIEFLSDILAPAILAWGGDNLLWGDRELQWGVAPETMVAPEIDHTGRLFSLQGKIYAILEDLDVPGNETKRFRVAPPLRKSGLFSSQYGTLQLGDDLVFSGRLDKFPSQTQNTDGWITYRLLFAEDAGQR